MIDIYCSQLTIVYEGHVECSVRKLQLSPPSFHLLQQSVLICLMRYFHLFVPDIRIPGSAFSYSSIRNVTWKSQLEGTAIVRSCQFLFRTRDAIQLFELCLSIWFELYSNAERLIRKIAICVFRRHPYHHEVIGWLLSAGLRRCFFHVLCKYIAAADNGFLFNRA